MYGGDMTPPQKRWKVSIVTSKKKYYNEKWERKPAAKY